MPTTKHLNLQWTPMATVNFLIRSFISASSLFLLSFIDNFETQAATVPAIFIFGDSTVDSGNNNYLLTPWKANFLPYGRDFPAGIPTGRASNGKLATDFLSQRLGLADTVPAYLDPEFQGPILLTGACFASAASGLYDSTAKLTNVLTVGQQVGLFKQYKSRLIEMVGLRNSSRIISEGLFLISSGTVDFTNVYYVQASIANKYSLPEFENILLQTLHDFTESIYAEGGRRIAVLGIPPFGCLPSQITLHNLLAGNCVDEMNKVAADLNVKIQSLIESINRTFPGISVTYVSIYDLLLDMSLHPSKYGFEVSRRGCCGTGRLEFGFLCNPTTPTCRDATKFVYWDSFHPTTSAYSILASHTLQTLKL